MNSHELARRLLELPDLPVLSDDEGIVGEVTEDAYDDGRMTSMAPCILLMTEEDE